MTMIRKVVTKLRKGKLSIRLTVALAACALVAVFAGIIAIAGAGSASSPRILSKNISYDDEIYIFYAVPVSSIANGETVALNIYEADGVTVKDTVSDYTIQTVWNEPCYVFRTSGNSPKNIKRVEYVRAVSSDGAVSPLENYSVLEYLLEKLFRDGYADVDENGGKEYIRRETYIAFLKYCISAQNLLAPNADPIADVNYVGVKGGTNVGICTDGTVTTPSYTESDIPSYKEFSYWTVKRYDIFGNLLESDTLEEGDSLIAGGFVKIEAAYKKNPAANATTVYDDSTVNLVVSTSDTSSGEYKAALYLKEKLRYLVGRVDINVGMIDSKADLNVLLCASEARASSLAYSKLAENRSAKMFSEAKYTVYAEDGILAVAYDENVYTSIQSVTYAAEKLFEELFNKNDTTVISNGSCIIDTVDLIDEQKKLDAIEESEDWEILYAAAMEKYGAEQGEELVDAIKTYYTIRSDELIEWYANLYDPGIGGFYASTTGKEYYGYLPLIETTGQLLGHLNSLDLFRSKGNSTKRALPEVVRAQVIYFIKSVQDSNGYFYNPAISKAQADATVVRRGRDLSRCTSLLSNLGSAPTYNTPTGVAGDGITADQFWASTGLDSSLKPRVPTSLEDYKQYLGSIKTSATDAASAVSCIITSAVTLADSTEDSEAYLKSHKAFSDYILGLAIDSSPYSVGNELNGTYKIIEAESKKLGAYVSPEGTAEANKPWYEGMTLCDMLISWLTDHINEMGLFGTTYMTDGKDETQGVEFVNTNGFFKIISIYNAWKVAYPEPLLAAKGLLAGIRGDEASTGNICNVYNAWNALGSLLSNIKNYKSDKVSEAEQAETRAFVDGVLGEDGPAAVIKSYQKQLPYRCSDGTFSNSVNGSAATFPGNLPAGLGIKEGNVDAIGFGFYATVDAMYSVFGLSSSAVRYYYDNHYLSFVETILNVAPVTEKLSGSVNDKDYVNGFDDYSPETNIRVVTFNTGSGNGLVNVIAVTDSGNGNKAVRIEKLSGTTAATVAHYATYQEDDANVMIYGARIKVESVKSVGYLQFSIGSSSTSPFLVLLRTKTGIGSALTFNNVSTGAKVGEWFNLRFEYRITARDENGDPTAFELRGYVNNTLVYTTTSLYETTSGKRKIYDIDEYSTCTFSVNEANTGVYWIDDIYMRKLK